MAEFWEQVATAAAHGRQFHVVLKSEWEVEVPKAPRYAQKRLPKVKYAGAWGEIKRPACWNRSCRRFLKRDQPMACSIECERALVVHACRILALSAHAVGIINRPDDFDPEEHGRRVLAQVEKLSKMLNIGVDHATSGHHVGISANDTWQRRATGASP